MSDTRYKMQDPRTQYPQPPFKPQHQSAPGLEKKMDPKPDHGETSYKGSGKLQGRKALVTGADSGIGRAVAIAFAREGADVVINYLPSEEADAREVMKVLEGAGVKAYAMPGDIQSETFCQDLVKGAEKFLGGLDVLVNNAGTMSSQKDFLDITTEEFDKTVKTNIYGMFWITKAAVPLMKPGSSIINTTSIQGYDPSKNIVDYAMTKAAIANFTKGVSKQLIEKGIRVNGVAPGPFWTPIQPAGQPPENVEKLGAKVTLGRPGQPVEIAPLYVLFASQEGSYLTGEIFGATGGEGVA